MAANTDNFNSPDGKPGGGAQPIDLEDIEAKLCDYLEGDLDAYGRAEVEKHLASNAQYTKLLDDLKRTRTFLRDLPRGAAPTDLLEPVHTQLERSALLGNDRPGDVSFRIRRWPQLMTLAAILLLAVGLGVMVYSLLPSPDGRKEVAVGPTTRDALIDSEAAKSPKDRATDPSAEPTGGGAKVPDFDLTRRTTSSGGAVPSADRKSIAAVESPDAREGGDPSASGSLSLRPAKGQGAEKAIDATRRDMDEHAPRGERQTEPRSNDEHSLRLSSRVAGEPPGGVSRAEARNGLETSVKPGDAAAVADMVKDDRATVDAKQMLAQLQLQRFSESLAAADESAARQQDVLKNAAVVVVVNADEPTAANVRVLNALDQEGLAFQHIDLPDAPPAATAPVTRRAVTPPSVANAAGRPGAPASSAAPAAAPAPAILADRPAPATGPAGGSSQKLEGPAYLAQNKARAEALEQVPNRRAYVVRMTMPQVDRLASTVEQGGEGRFHSAVTLNRAAPPGEAQRPMGRASNAGIPALNNQMYAPRATSRYQKDSALAAGNAGEAVDHAVAVATGNATSAPASAGVGSQPLGGYGGGGQANANTNHAYGDKPSAAVDQGGQGVRAGKPAAGAYLPNATDNELAKGGYRGPVDDALDQRHATTREQSKAYESPTNTTPAGPPAPAVPPERDVTARWNDADDAPVDVVILVEGEGHTKAATPASPASPTTRPPPPDPSLYNK